MRINSALGHTSDIKIKITSSNQRFLLRIHNIFSKCPLQFIFNKNAYIQVTIIYIKIILIVLFTFMNNFRYNK